MELEYELTLDDLLAYQEHVAFSRFRRQARLRSLVSAIVTGGLCGALLYTQVKNLAAACVVSLIVALVIGTRWTSVERDRLRKRFRRIHRDSADPAIGHQRLILGQDGIDTFSRIGNSHLSWQAVSGADIDSSRCFIHLGPLKALVVPLSFVKSRDELESVLKSHLPEDRLQGIRGGRGA